MNPTLTLLLLAGQAVPTKALKPVVLVTNAAVTTVDRTIVETRPSEDRDALIKGRGYELRDFPDFVLAVGPDLLGTAEVRDQVAFFRTLAVKARSGKRAVSVQDLGKRVPESYEGSSVPSTTTRLGLSPRRPTCGFASAR